MLRVWVHGCEPGRVSDGSRLALCQTLSFECPSSIFFWPVYFVIPVPFSLSFLFVRVFLLLSLELCRCSSDLFCPADHVPDWQPRILLGMVQARSVNVKKTTHNSTLVMIYINTVGRPSSIKRAFLLAYLGINSMWKSISEKRQCSTKNRHNAQHNKHKSKRCAKKRIKARPAALTTRLCLMHAKSEAYDT